MLDYIRHVNDMHGVGYSFEIKCPVHGVWIFPMGSTESVGKFTQEHKECEPPPARPAPRPKSRRPRCRCLPVPATH